LNYINIYFIVFYCFIFIFFLMGDSKKQFCKVNEKPLYNLIFSS